MNGRLKSGNQVVDFILGSFQRCFVMRNRIVGEQTEGHIFHAPYVPCFQSVGIFVVADITVGVGRADQRLGTLGDFREKFR